MAEQLVNEFTVNRPIDEAWAVITDVEKIAPCLPGAQLQEIEGDVYRGVVKVKLGSITPQFKGQATFIDRDDPGHRAVLKAEGRDTGGRGNAAAEITAQAESLSPTSTRCIVTTDLHITGRVAQFGRGILGDVSKKLMAQFASNLNTMLDEQGANGAASGNGDAEGSADGDGGSDATANGAESAVAAESAPAASAESTGPGPDAPPATSDLPPAGADQSGPQPRVRKIEGPDTEPVDLAGVAGPAVLKRLGPLLVVLLVALILLRRRR
jgi:carbon monoxide dehydrogenase subunit G